MATSLGRVRSENQDRLIHLPYLADLAPKGSTLTILADGMGGMASGGLAAEIACAAFAASFLDQGAAAMEQRLRQAVLDADKAVFQELRGKGGTTLTAAVITKGVAFVVSVGDSRLYAYEKDLGLKQVTDDDTLGEMLRKSGQGDIAVDRATQLVQFVGLGEDVEPHLYVAESSQNSILMLTSDGAHSIGQELLERLCVANEGPVRIAESVLATATALGGNDNASVAVLQADPPDSQVDVKDGAITCITAAAGMELSIFLIERGRDRFRVEESAENKQLATGINEQDADTPTGAQRPIVSTTKPITKRRAQKRSRKPGKKTKTDAKKAGALSLDFPEGNS